MEISRLRYDDGPSRPRRLIGWKTQRGPWLAGLLAGGLDVQLQKRQDARAIETHDGMLGTATPAHPLGRAGKSLAPSFLAGSPALRKKAPRLSMSATAEQRAQAKSRRSIGISAASLIGRDR